MFERYTEQARRAIFFARYEASSFGSPEIGTEHLLLGILREYPMSSPDVRSNMLHSIHARIQPHPTPAPAVDLPLAFEAKQALAYGAEEAARLGHQNIDNGHLLLGLLRVENCLGARLIREQQITADAIRDDLQKRALGGKESHLSFESGAQSIDQQIAKRLRALCDQLADLNLAIQRIEKRLDDLSSRISNSSKE